MIRQLARWYAEEERNVAVNGGNPSLQGAVFCKSDMTSLLWHTVGCVITHNCEERSHVLPGQFRPMADDDYAASVPFEQAASDRLGSLELRHGVGPLVRPDRGESRTGEGDEAQRADGPPATAGMVLTNGVSFLQTT